MGSDLSSSIKVTDVVSPIKEFKQQEKDSSALDESESLKRSRGGELVDKEVMCMLLTDVKASSPGKTEGSRNSRKSSANAAGAKHRPTSRESHANSNARKLLSKMSSKVGFYLKA